MKTPPTIRPLWIDAVNEDPVEVCLVIMQAIADGRVSDFKCAPRWCAENCFAFAFFRRSRQATSHRSLPPVLGLIEQYLWMIPEHP